MKKLLSQYTLPISFFMVLTLTLTTHYGYPPVKAQSSTPGTITVLKNRNGLAVGVRIIAGVLSCDVSVMERPGMSGGGGSYMQSVMSCQKGSTLLSTSSDIVAPGVTTMRSFILGSDSLLIQFQPGTPFLSWQAAANGVNSKGTL